MKMKMLLVVLACGVLQAAAQEIHYDPSVFREMDDAYLKLEKRFQKQKYDQLLKKLDQLRSRNSKDAEPEYFKTLVYYEMAASSRNYTDQKRYITRMVKSYDKAMKKDVRSRFALKDEVLRQHMHDMLQQETMALIRSSNTSKSSYYVRSLARYFDDTLTVYHELFPRRKVERETNRDTMAQAQLRPTSKPLVRADYGTRFKCPPQPVVRDRLTQYASKFVGSRYKWGGEAPSGFDCSGFVLYVYRNFGYDFNHSSREIAKIGEAVTTDGMRKGDLLFFGTRNSNGTFRITHMAMCYDDQPGALKVIHATNKGVIIDGLNESDYWTRKLLFVKNIVTPGQ